jgi:hypothetical protein
VEIRDHREGRRGFQEVLVLEHQGLPAIRCHVKTVAGHVGKRPFEKEAWSR